MKLMKSIVATVATLTMTTGAFAETNLTAETASPGGATHLSPAPLDRNSWHAGDREYSAL